MKNIEDMNQDELFDFLIECGAENLKKVDSIEEAGVYFIDDEKDSLSFDVNVVPPVETIIWLTSEISFSNTNLDISLENFFSTSDTSYSVSLETTDKVAA